MTAKPIVRNKFKLCKKCGSQYLGEKCACDIVRQQNLSTVNKLK